MRINGFAAMCGVSASLVLAALGGVAAQSTPASSELIYTPVRPCRAFDTRATSPIAANQTRGFYISGSADFAAQGGPAGGCGVPAAATAITISLTTLNQSASGYLTAYAYDSARPSVTSMYYAANATITGAVTSSINRGNLAVYSSKQTNVAGDVTGYFAPLIHGFVYMGNSSSPAVVESGARILSAQYVPTGGALLTVDRDVSDCSVAVTPYYGSRIASATALAQYVQVVIQKIGKDGVLETDSERFHVVVHC